MTANQLTVFSKDNCPGCVAIAQHFERQGINHVVVKIFDDPAGMAFFREKGHRSVPQVYTADGTLLGSNLMDILKLPAGVLDIFK